MTPKKILPLLLTVVLVFTLLPAQPAYAASKTISAPGDWTGDITLSDGDTLTIDSAAGSPASATNIIVASGANSVTIIGSGQNINNLYITVNSAGVKVTIQNLWINAPASQIHYLVNQPNTILNLLGTNKFMRTNGGSTNSLKSDTPLEITSDASGTLDVMGYGAAAVSGTAINITGSAIINVSLLTNNYGIMTRTLTVGQDASLNIEGRNAGAIVSGISGSLNIINDGKLTASGIEPNSTAAINIFSSLTITNTGIMALIGTRYPAILNNTSADVSITNSGQLTIMGGVSNSAISVSGGIKTILMNDPLARTSIRNNGNTVETIDFSTTLDIPDVYSWAVTNASITSGEKSKDMTLGIPAVTSADIAFVASSSDNNIFGVFVPGQAESAIVSGTNILLTVPYGTDVTKLVPTFYISPHASISPASGAPQDFTEPVTYTVTAQNGDTRTYLVTVTFAPAPIPPLPKAQAPTKSDYIYSLGDRPYTGKTQIVPIAAKSGAGKVIAIYYEGALGTKYSRSTVAPKNIGSYKVSIDTDSSAIYGAAKAMDLGIFKIVPVKNSISKITVGKKKMTVKWNKVPASQKISKYQLRYRVKGTTKWKTKTYATSKSSATIKGLKKDMKYEVQVQSHKIVSKEKHHSGWSKIKTSKKIK